MPKQPPVEQITLYSAEAPDVDPGVRNLQFITAELFQKNQFKEIQRLFRIFDDRVINVTEKNAGHTRSYMVNPIILDSKPFHKRSINLLYIVASILFAGSSYGTLYLKQRGIELLQSPYTYTAIILAATMSLICLVFTIRSIKSVWQFRTNFGKVPVMEIINNIPSRSTVQEFIDHLSKVITNAGQTNYFTEAQNLAAELSEHRRLRDEGIISNSEYENVKSQIMGLHGSIHRSTDTIH